MAKDFDLRFSVSEELLVARISQRIKRLQPDSPRIREIMNRMGLLIVNQAKVNIRRHKLIDTGRLINSIRHQLRQNGNRFDLVVGSFGVPYAAFWEGGFDGDMLIKPHSKRLTHFWGVPIEPIIVDVRSHKRTVKVKARPYLKPAIEEHRGFLIETLRQMMRAKP